MSLLRPGKACSLRTVPATDDSTDAAGGPNAPGSDDLLDRVAGISWYHSIDLGHGIVTPGNPPDKRMIAAGLPEMRAKTVLDIGAWDGYWSFLAENQQAARVVAMDHYAWSVDFAARLRYWERCESEGRIPDHRLDFTEFWRPETRPGRAGFDLARSMLRSAVEPVHADFMTVDPEQFGRFDVVLFLGVLYHVREPLSALERVCGLTSEVAVIETEAVAVLGMPDARLLEFHESGGLRGDYTNWFVPTEAALHALCKAAGFARVVTRIGPPPRARLLKSGARRLTSRTATADRRSRDSSHPAVTRYRIAVHAYPDRA
jgi:tRNA (mo5U34)-methyltransferase